MRAMIVDESLQGRQGGSFNHYPGLAPRARWTAGVGAGGRARLRGSGKRSARTKQKDWTVEEDRWRRTNQRGRRRPGRRDNKRHRRPPLSPRAPHQPRPARGQFVGGRNCPATAANRSRRRDPWGQMNLVFQSPSVGAQLWPTTTERSGRTVRRGLALIEFVYEGQKSPMASTRDGGVAQSTPPTIISDPALRLGGVALPEVAAPGARAFLNQPMQHRFESRTGFGSQASLYEIAFEGVAVAE